MFPFLIGTVRTVHLALIHRAVPVSIPHRYGKNKEYPPETTALEEGFHSS